MTDELFDYFGKGSKKFEPLDDDLDLPEVSPKRKSDAPDNAAELESAGATDPATDDIALPAEPVAAAGDSIDDDDVFAGFGAGLFEASTDELPPRKQVAKTKPATTEVKSAITEQTKPEAKTKPASARPADQKPAVEEASASDSSEDSEDTEGGAWDFIAGVLGIGGKKNKTDEDITDQTQLSSDEVPAPVKKDNSRSRASQKKQPEADVKTFFQEPKPAPEAAVDALFNTTDDGLDLAGWGDDDDSDEVEDPIAADSG